MHRPTHLGHVHLKVRTLDRAVTFYRDVIGLDVTERHNRYAFLSFGEQHHDLALQAVGETAEGPGPGVGLYHTAFEVESAEALTALYDRIRAEGVDVLPVDHGISKALYFDDPDGNGVELYLDTRAETGTDQWQGTNEAFDPYSIDI